MSEKSGPLSGLRVIEIAGIGPGPFCGMMLADMGAEVIAVDRVGTTLDRPELDCSRRGKRALTLNLKSESGRAALLRLVEGADALLEGFRPGVMERLGLGPDECQAINPRLVYGRMTGWGQSGPLSGAAGHDINYISLTGALHAIGLAGEKPTPPLNLVGDFGGGGMMLAFGMVCALLEARESGRGQVIDAAMTDGSAALMAAFHTAHARGAHRLERGVNRLDSGAHFYNTYETADGKYISIGSIEPQFYALLLDAAELPRDDFADQLDQQKWPALRERLTEVFKRKSRDQWCALMEGTDICFAPVLDLQEAQSHPHNAARGTYVRVGEMQQPAPAPRLSRTGGGVAFPGREAGSDTEVLLAALGYDERTIKAMRQAGECG